MSKQEKAINRKMGRRQLFKLAGAGAAGAALVGVSGGPLSPNDTESVVLAQDEEDEFEWDDEFDVVVVGSGGGASAAAVAAAEQGASVVMLEKSDSWGGTTGHSGGGSWVPNNYKMQEAGIEDSLEDTLRYCCRVCFPMYFDPDAENYGLPQIHFDRLETFVTESAEVFNWFEEIGAFQTIMDPEYPIYYGGIPEAEAIPLAGQALFPVDEDGNQGSGGEMIRQFRQAIDEREVDTRTEHRVERVVRNEEGRVLGVEATTAEGDAVLIAASGGVVFASGGFANNRDMSFAYIRGPIFGGGAVASNQGDFVHIANSVGATFSNMQHAWLQDAVLDDAADADGRIPTISMAPGDSMIYVNRFGHRVVNEKMQYQDRPHVYFNWDPRRAEYTNRVLVQVYDQRTATEYAGAYPIPAEDSDAEHVVRGETLEELAENIDQKMAEFASSTGNARLDEDFVSNLRGTISAFNEAAEAGRDRYFLRGGTPIEVHNHLFGSGGVESGYPNVTMHPISDEGPYYAVLLVASTFDTKGGPLTTTDGQILDSNYEPIPGLYGAGNCIAQPVGQSYPGPGSTLGPTLTYGYLAGVAAAGSADGDASEDDDTGDDESQVPDEDADETEDDEPEEEDEGEDEASEGADDEEAAGGNGENHVVEMNAQNEFVPEHLTIAAGDTVIWVTVGNVPHTATADPDEALDPEGSVQLPDGAEPWDSGTLQEGEEFSHTFTVPGEYTYFCIPHETVGMIGYITVE